MIARDGWEPFRHFDDAASAQLMCDWLMREQVPAKVMPCTLENGLEANYCVFVSSDLAHRARWVVAQLPPTDEELEWLATGKLVAGKQG